VDYNQKTPFIDNYFIGHEKEMEFLLKSLADFESSDTSLLLVKGSAGIGKTTLIQQVLLKYRKEKCFKLYGEYSNQPGQVPYQAKAWMKMLILSLRCALSLTIFVRRLNAVKNC